MVLAYGPKKKDHAGSVRLLSLKERAHAYGP